MLTLAHIADPHVAPLPQPSLGQLTSKRLLGYLSWSVRRKHVHTREVLDALTADLLVTKPDHIAVVGDLTNIALPTEFPLALAWLRRLGDPRDVSVIPGNHDTYVDEPWSRTVDLWDAYMRGDADEGDPARRADGAADFPWVRVRRGVALVGVSTAVATLPFLATGAVGERQLLRLREELAALGRRGLFRVVLIHHPPLDELTKWRKRLIDSAAFARVIEDAGAELVLHGHTHAATVAWMRGAAGRVPTVGTTSASANGSDEPDLRARYNVFHIDRQAGRWHVEMETRALGTGGDFGPLERMPLTDSALEEMRTS